MSQSNSEVEMMKAKLAYYRDAILRVQAVAMEAGEQPQSSSKLATIHRITEDALAH